MTAKTQAEFVSDTALPIVKDDGLTVAARWVDKVRAVGKMKQANEMFQKHFMDYVVGPGKQYESFIDCEMAPVGSALKKLDTDKGIDYLFVTPDKRLQSVSARVLCKGLDLTIREEIRGKKTSELAARTAQWRNGTIPKTMKLLTAFARPLDKTWKLFEMEAYPLYTAVEQDRLLNLKTPERYVYECRSNSEDNSKFAAITPDQIKQLGIPMSIIEFPNPDYAVNMEKARQREQASWNNFKAELQQRKKEHGYK